jgi:hypothetical protein
VAISYRRAVGDSWYGDSLGNNDSFFDIPQPVMGDKGAGASRWKTGIMLYNPDDLAAVCMGTKQPWEPQPYAVYDFDRFSLKPEGGDGQAGGMAFDPASGRLFFIEHNGDPETGAYALIHVWRLLTPTSAPRLQVSLTNHTLMVQWNTINDGSTQRVQAATSLDPGTPWADVGMAYAGDGSTKSYTKIISDAAPAQFFRVMVNSAP